VWISDPRLGEVERTNDQIVVVCEAYVVMREVVVKQNRSEDFRVEPRCNAEKILQETLSFDRI
jgi:hypothetical protein